MKRIISLMGALIFIIACAGAALANSVVPYDTYNYDYRERIVMTPAAYIPAGNVSGLSLNIGAFKSPNDVCVSEDGLVFIADTGNNRIVVLSRDLRTVADVIDGFEDADGTKQTFNAPTGVSLSDSGRVYIADSLNHRVVVLEKDRRTFFKYYQDPQGEVLPANFQFTPIKVTVDYADRLYAISERMFQGILMFDVDGEFTGFFGTIEVSLSMWEKFWRAIATKEERSRQQLFIPTEFTGLDVDASGFIYACNRDTGGAKAIRRLNPKGEDVLKQGENKNTGGDLEIDGRGGTGYTGASDIVDVVYRDKGIYSLLDRKRGRVFTYDNEGNLLYIFGGLGNQAGTFRSPAAIEHIGNKLIVLDSIRNELLIFQETQYGALINDAVGLRYDGDESRAVERWKEVLLLNENLELANVGIGKAYLTAGDNEQAMHYLKLGMNRTYYSIAFKRYRNDVLKQNLSWVLTIAIVLIAAFVVWRYIRRRRRGGESKEGLL